MNELTKISTPEITLDGYRTQQALENTDGEWAFPEFLSVFNVNMEKESFTVTAYIPMDHNLLFRKNWAHILVRPFSNVTPSYPVMSKIADAFFKADHYAMQVIPKRSNYISREDYTLHLWNMQAKCNFQFDEVFQKVHEEFSGLKDDIYLKVSEDSNSNRYLVIATKNGWLYWEDIVAYKEIYLGSDTDAVIINRNFEADVSSFDSSEYKVIIIWEASSIELPDKNLV